MPASSQASSELSTASLTAVRRAFLGLSKPSKCLFFAKNSLTDISRCLAAIDSAVTARRFGCSPVSLTFGIFVGIVAKNFETRDRRPRPKWLSSDRQPKQLIDKLQLSE